MRARPEVHSSTTGLQWVSAPAPGLRGNRPPARPGGRVALHSTSALMDMKAYVQAGVREADAIDAGRGYRLVAAWSRGAHAMRGTTSTIR